MTRLSRAYRLAAEAHRLSVPERLNAHQHERSIKRYGQVALGESLHFLSFKRFIAQFKDYDFLDSGWEAVVLAAKDQSHVMKILLRTNTLSLVSSGKLAAKYQTASDKARDFLGDQWLETTFYPHSMKTFPMLTRGYAVVAIQERIQPIISFQSAEELVDENLWPRLEPELARLAKNIHQMYEQTGFYPDIRGVNNIVLVDEDGHEKLKIIDTTLQTDVGHLQRLIPEKGKTIGEDIEEKLALWDAALAGNSKSTGFRGVTAR